MPMIIGEIRRYLRDNNTIHVSRSVRDLAYKALQAREQLSRTMAKEPSIDDIVKYINDDPASAESYTNEEIINALEAIVEPVSLFEPVFNENNGSSESIFVMDQVRDMDNTDDMWLEDIALQEAMRKLNEREKSIIDMRFFKGKTQMEIADEIGMSTNEMRFNFIFSRGKYACTYNITYGFY